MLYLWAKGRSSSPLPGAEHYWSPSPFTPEKKFSCAASSFRSASFWDHIGAGVEGLSYLKVCNSSHMFSTRCLCRVLTELFERLFPNKSGKSFCTTGAGTELSDADDVYVKEYGVKATALLMQRRRRCLLFSLTQITGIGWGGSKSSVKWKTNPGWWKD